MKKTKLIRKFKSLIERIQLSESEYDLMKYRSEVLKRLESSIKIDSKRNSKSITDKHGNEMYRFVGRKLTTVDIDIEQLFESFGLVYDANNTIVNVRR